MEVHGKNRTKHMDSDERNSAGRCRPLCFTGAVLLLLTGFSAAMCLMPDKAYSPQERRMLSERPYLTGAGLADGSFQQDYETYLGEQFPGRDSFVTLRVKLQRLLGDRDVNGIYFGKDGYLLEKYREQDFDWERAEENISRTAEFLRKYPQAKALFVPVKSSVLSGKLPPFAEISGEQRFFRQLLRQLPAGQQIVAAEGLNAHEGEYLYYRTDHHWTTLGAYYAYCIWAREMGFTPVTKEGFSVTAACDTFLGTSYAKVRTGGRADTVFLYEAKKGHGFELDYNMGEFRSDSFYDLEKLKGDDAYSVFFGGNQALVDIRKNGGKADGGTLMVIKDSFGNCFAPFAANHYRRTVVVDLRYVNIPVSKLLEAYPADDILILYNSVQFMEDKDIHKLR